VQFSVGEPRARCPVDSPVASRQLGFVSPKSLLDDVDPSWRRAAQSVLQRRSQAGACEPRVTVPAPPARARRGRNSPAVTVGFTMSNSSSTPAARFGKRASRARMHSRIMPSKCSQKLFTVWGQLSNVAIGRLVRAARFPVACWQCFARLELQT
jgi:hypothetical protein